MRVVGGRLRGRNIASPASNEIRPTADRLHESVFNILLHAYDNPIEGARVLDLFAGTGALGIEAISRGAKFALFVDNGAEARALLRNNVESLGLGGVTKVYRRDATNPGPAHPVEPFSLGVVYKKGSRYEFETDFVVDATDGVETADVQRIVQPIPLRVPDVYGAGVTFRPNESWTVLSDVVRVRYGQAENGPGFLNLYQQLGQGGREALEDETEFHAGAEYTWAGSSDWLFAARAGVYTDPDHDGLAGVDSEQTHYTVGGGFVVKNRLQLDVAGNFAKLVKEGLVSLVVRF